MRGKLVLLAAAAVAVVAVVVAVRSRPSRSPSAAADPQALRDEVAELRSEVRDLRASATRDKLLLASNLAKQSGARSAPKSVEATASDGEEDSPTGKARHELTSKEIVAKLDERFYRQAPRTSWGETAAARAAASLASQIPAGSTVGKIDCRETLCRIEATHTTIAAFNKFLDDAIQRNRNGLWKAGFAAEVTDQSANSVSSVTYYARENESVPDVASETE